MSFVVVPANSGSQSGGFSLPNYCSFCVSGDGNVAQVLINALGFVDPVIGGAYDLKTIFTGAGMLFRSYPLLRAFRKVATGGVGAEVNAANQFKEFLDIKFFGMNSAGYDGSPSVAYIADVGAATGTGTPFLAIGGPDVAGLWRVDLRLRHTLTN